MIHICCVICKEFFLPNSEMCVTMCGHFYHQLCIDKWRDRSGSCPQCRRKLNVKPVKAYIDSCESSNADNIWDIKVKMDHLRESIDNMKKKNELDNESIEKLKKTLEEHSSKNNLLRERIKPLNERVKSLVDVVESLKPLCAKHQLYEARIESIKNLNVILQGSESEIKSLLKRTQSCPSAIHNLCFYVVALQERSNNNKKNYQKEHNILQQEYDRICKRLREEKRKKNEIMPEIHLNKEEKITKVDENSSLKMDDSSWSFPGRKKKVVVVNLRDKPTMKKEVINATVEDDDEDDDFDDRTFLIPTVHPNKTRLSKLTNVKESRNIPFRDGGCSAPSASLSATWGPIRSILSTPFEERNLSKASVRKGLSKSSVNDAKSKKSCADIKTLYSYFPRRSSQ